MICKDKIRRKKTLCSTKKCATQGLKFLGFLGRSQAAKSCLFGAVRRCRDFPKTSTVIGKRIRPQKGKSTHSLSISPFFPELFAFSGFMKNRLSHYNYSFLQLFGQGFFPLFSSLSLILFLSSSCFFLHCFSLPSHSFSYHRMNHTRLL